MAVALIGDLALCLGILGRPSRTLKGRNYDEDCCEVVAVSHGSDVLKAGVSVAGHGAGMSG